jgi:AcrR family transcriptional regulator
MNLVTLADNNKAIPSPFSKGRQYRLKFQSILSDASKLFNWQGSRATTLADIAGSMNLTKTCLYYYVNNKQDLIYYCYVASCDLWLEATEQAHKLEGSGLDKVVAMVVWHFDRYMQTLDGRASHPAMLTEVSSLDPEHAEDIQQRWSAVFKHCQEMVEEGIGDGSIVGLNAEVIVLAVFSVLQWLPVWMNRTHAADAARVIAGVVDILVMGWLNKPIYLPKSNCQK